MQFDTRTTTTDIQDWLENHHPDDSLAGFGQDKPNETNDYEPPASPHQVDPRHDSIEQLAHKLQLWPRGDAVKLPDWCEGNELDSLDYQSKYRLVIAASQAGRVRIIDRLRDTYRHRGLFQEEVEHADTDEPLMARRTLAGRSFHEALKHDQEALVAYWLDREDVMLIEEPEQCERLRQVVRCLNDSEHWDETWAQYDFGNPDRARQAMRELCYEQSDRVLYFMYRTGAPLPFEYSEVAADEIDRDAYEQREVSPGTFSELLGRFRSPENLCVPSVDSLFPHGTSDMLEAQSADEKRSYLQNLLERSEVRRRRIREFVEQIDSSAEPEHVPYDVKSTLCFET